MILSSAIRPAWTIAHSMWLARRINFLALLLAPLVCGWLFHLTTPDFRNGEGANFLGYLPMGLSLFLTFVFCNFTESDRRQRADGFPARLFTLPVSTRTLMAAPILFSVLAVGVIYSAWAKLALPGLGRILPLGWPILYLATGMICYQAIVWTLARFRIVRIIVLGIGGTLLATGWLALRDGVERDLMADAARDGSIRFYVCVTLAVMSVGALLIANFFVENQRRGGMSRWNVWSSHVEIGKSENALVRRTFLERLADALPRGQKRFGSPARAQFWFEWRRHGSLLPLAVGGVLFLIMAPAPFCAPISAEMTGITLCWILVVPLLLAFVLGKGFGKADLWSKEPGLPLFHATRPLSNGDWIGAKMKAATLAVVSSWTIVFVLTPLWLWLWCDYEFFLNHWRNAAAENPKIFCARSVVIVAAMLMLFTWRFLIGSLYLGLSGKTWMLNVAACGVFLSIFSPLLGAAPFVQNNIDYLIHPSDGFRRILIGLFVAKAALAIALTSYARWKGFVTNRAIGTYLIVWLVTTVLLIVLVRQIVPWQLVILGWTKRVFTLLALFAVPLLRVSYSPIALAKNRRR